VNILVVGLVVGLAVALALWVVSLPASVPAYTRPVFYIALIVVALFVALMNLPA
jgi:predicted signal transduction protein with EAL and GGDEF domain